MNAPYICPDCSAEHDEPFEATLGHLARCLDCLVADEAARDDVSADIAFEIAA
jgi:hypothetical protein